MMTSCEDHNFPCQNPDYGDFDKIAATELAKPIAANVLVNESEFCMMIPVNEDWVIGDLNHSLFLKTLRGQSGLYHLWVDYEACGDHGTHTMVCAYVGKGPPENRVASHIKTKWPRSSFLYATFTPMENRLAKYYEQLFLDTYNFHLNKSENSGEKTLYAVWDSERYIIGTHANEVSSLSKMQDFDYW
ncbi:hypothetical protein RWA02_02560 [Sinorhizobium meliloti]|uniref:hypothetical protein n=3 Tax=Rhizobium meliloti TaxID=382 RepID=UPI0019145840|nr:hypothetical protein [Sinorhizobium meliloti]